MEGVKFNFPDATAFYDARNYGIRSYKEYMEVKRSGTADKAWYTRALKLGFIEGFNKFKAKYEKEKQNAPENFDMNKIDTPLKLYEYAVEMGFKDYGDFEKAFFSGFATANEYADARDKGFTSDREYREAIVMGLPDVDEYKEAKQHGIKSSKEYEKYLQLSIPAKSKYAFDQVLFINALKQLKDGTKVSLDKMKDLLKEQEGDFFGTDAIPLWYSRRLKSEQDFSVMLTNNADLQDHGQYYPDKKYYEAARVLSQRVLVDGANVAFANQPKGSEFTKAKYAHLLNVIRQLKSMRFKNIVVVCDLSLKHKATDLNVLDEIEKEKVDYREAPLADEMILDLAKTGKSYIVSNDLYREYQKKDEWVAENYNKLRIPFVMKKGEAKLVL
jgi:hypothetical protein